MNKALITFFFRLCVCFCIAHTVLASTASSQTFPPQHKTHVLYLNAYHRGYAWSDSIEQGLRDTFKAADEKVVVYSEYLDTRRFPQQTHLSAVAEALAQKSPQAYDLIVVSDNNAFDFAVHYREALFPTAPIVFCGYNEFTPAAVAQVSNITGIAEAVDVSKTIELALSVHPETESLVFVASDFSTTTTRNLHITQAALSKFPSYPVTWLKNLPSSVLEARLAALPAHSVVFIVGEASDLREAGFFPFKEYGHRLATASNAPVYSMWDFYLGTGIMGGHIITGFEQGRKSAELALRIINGEAAADIPVLTHTPAINILDYTVMQRFNVPASTLPSGTQIIHQPPSLYTQYRLYFWTASIAIIILLSVLTLLSHTLQRLRKAHRTLEQQQKLIQHHNEVRYQSLIATMAEGVVMQEQGGNILTCNAAAERILGLTQAQMMGRSSVDPRWRAVHEDGSDFPGQEHPAMVTLRTGEPQYNVVMGIHTPDAQLSWIQVNTQPMFQEGEIFPYAVVATFADITAYKQAMQALDKQHRTLQTVLTHLPVAVEVFSAPDARVQLYNLEAEKLLGQPVQPDVQIADLNQTYAVFVAGTEDLYPPEKMPLVRAMQGDICNIEDMEVRHPDGSRVLLQVTAAPIHDAQQQVTASVVIFQDITARKRTETRLKESEQRLQAAGRIAYDLIYEWDVTHNSLQWFGDVDHLLGYAAGCISHDIQTWLNLIHPQDLGMMKNAVEEHRISTHPIIYEYRILHHDGDYRYWNDRALPLLNEEGLPYKWVGVCSDITSRKRTEEALRNSERLYQSLVDSLPMNVYRIDLQGKLTFLNRTLLEEIGLPAKTILGKTAYDIYPAEVADKYRHDDEQVIQQGHPLYLIEDNRHPQTEQPRHVEVIKIPVFDNQQQVVGVQGIFWDITERIESEKERDKLVYHLEEAQHLAHLGSWEWNIQTGDITWSDELFRIFGREPGSQVPDEKAHQAQIHPDDWPPLQAAIKTSLDTGKYKAEYRLFRHNDRSERVISAKGKVIYNAQGKALRHVGSAMDITRRKHVEAELIRARQAAETANRAKSSFLANMSHELRTPLNAVLGYAQLLQNDPSLSEPHREDIHKIKHSGDYLLTLINDVLDLAKVEAGHLELSFAPCELHSFFNEFKDIFQLRTRDKNIEFQCQIASNLPPVVETDEKRLRQICLNLLNNAVKFTEQGYVRLRVEYQENILQIEVSDTGIGISKQDIPQLFQSFMQVGSNQYKHQGTGLGLAISQRLAQQMKGDISVESKEGHGSHFRFSIPIHQIDAKPTGHLCLSDNTQIIGYQRLDGHLQSLHILVVDDEAFNREMLQELLEQLNFKVGLAHDGQAAIQYTQTHLPDLILMDLAMPIMNGLEATRQILKQHPQLPIFAVSACVFKEDESNSRIAGCRVHIAKPLNTHILLTQLQHHLPLQWQYETRTHPSSNTLTAIDMQTLPAMLKADLGHAIIHGHAAKIQSVLSAIEQQHPALAEHLHQHLKAYAYEKVLALLEEP